MRLILDAPSAAAGPELARTIELFARSVQEKIQQRKPDDEQDRITLKLATELFASRKLTREGARIECVGFSNEWH